MCGLLLDKNVLIVYAKHEERARHKEEAMVMISITEKPFPIAKGKDAERIAEELRKANEPPKQGSIAYRLLEYAHRAKLRRMTAAKPRPL